MTEPDRPLRVCFPLEGFNASGGVRVITQIANGLAARGHRVRVIVPQYACKDHFGLTPQVELRIVPCRFRLAYYLWLALFSARNSDVCFATGYRTPYYLRVSAFLTRSRARLIYLIQHFEPLSHVEWVYSPGIRRAFLHRLALWSYRLALRRIAVSAWIRDRIGDPDMLVLPDGVDLLAFHPAPEVPREKDGFVIGVIGRQASWKGYDVFCAAVESLADAIRSRIRVVVASQEPMRLPANVQASLIAPSNDSEVSAFYRRCDAFVFPSLVEGFGLPALEAMACATPVIVSDCGGVREFANETNSLIVPPNDAPALAQAISRMISDESLRESLRTAGLGTAQQFSIGRMIEQYASIVEESHPDS